MIDFLEPERAVLAVIDVQENHFPHVFDGHAVLDRIVRVASLARLMDVPVVWTEHYPSGFGRTLEPLAEALEGFRPIVKRAFGCFGVPEFVSALEATGRRDLYVVGTETPICVLQTALGALQSGYRTIVLGDCVSARREYDHGVALKRMRRAGAVEATWEMVAYEWLRSADHPRFKRVLPLVKGASTHSQVGGGSAQTQWGGSRNGRGDD